MRAEHAAVVASMLVACGRGPEVQRTEAGGDAPPPRAVAVALDAAAPASDAPPVDDELQQHLWALDEEHGWEFAPSMDWLVAHPDRARPPLIRLMESDLQDMAVKRALEVLGRIGHPDDVAVVAERLHRGHELGAWDAAMALAVMPHESAYAALIDATGSTNLHSARAVKKALK